MASSPQQGVQRAMMSIAAAAPDTPRPATDRMTFGRLIAHGVAKHEFRAGAASSYYIRLETMQGAKMFWSPSLESAFAQSRTQPQLGDQVGLRENSIDPVSVVVRKRDAAGIVVNEQQYDTPRSHWLIEKREFFDQCLVVAEALRNEKFHPREAIRAHPELLPAYLVLDSVRKLAQEQQVPTPDAQRFVAFMRAALAHAIERAEPLPALRLRAPARSQNESARER